MGAIPIGAVATLVAWVAGLAVALVFDGLVVPIAAGLACAVAVAAVWHVRQQDGSDEGLLALLAFAPLHLAILATGALASPLIPLAAAWAVAMGWTTTPARAAAILVTALMLLGGGTAMAEGVRVPGLLAVLLALGGGGFLGAALRQATLRLRLRQRRLAAIEEEARRGLGGGASPSERVRILEAALDSARLQTGALRAVLWQVEADNNRIVPRLALPGPPPRPVNLAGTPLRWVWEERVPLRLEARAPGAGALGADGGACVVPVDDDTILAFEFDAARLPPDASVAADAGRYVGALLELQRAQGVADAARRRFDDLLGVLERLASAGAVEEWAGTLAETARSLAGGTGADVGTWEESEGGRVLALVGDDGGPAVGDSILAADSETALAIRAGTVLVREDLRPGQGRPPVVSSTERWFARPRALATFPLETATGGVIGVLSVWNADRTTLDSSGIATLRTLAPYAALQLRQFVFQDTLRQRAERDALTGLPNRGAFDERLDVEVARFRRYRHPLSLIVLDVDHFKRVNDTWGHDAGDAVLRQLGQILAASIRETDQAARLGGEEFAVLVPETDLAQAVETAERIRVAVENATVEHAGERLAVRISAGVATCPAVVRDPESLLVAADGALYASKQAGRNRVTAASSAGQTSSAPG